jgi:hypothetical protein
MTGSRRWPLSNDAFQLARALSLGLRLEQRGRRWALLPAEDIPEDPHVSWQRVTHVQELLGAKYLCRESGRATLTPRGLNAVRREAARVTTQWVTGRFQSDQSS